MALRIIHQIGALAGTPIADNVTPATTQAPASVNASAVWRFPSQSGNPPIQKRIVAEIESSPLTPVSRRRSPLLASSLPRLTIACQALTSEDAVTAEIEHRAAGIRTKAKGVPVFVMLPLDTVRSDGGGLNRRKAMTVSLQALKSAGVEGVMVDVWWGLVEKDRPGEYDWRGYAELMEMAAKIGLKVQAVMSFHQCGGNVGDSCT